MQRDLERLDPHDRLFAAIVRQAIRDYQDGQKQRTPQFGKREDVTGARAFLFDLGLLDAAGEVTVTEQCLL
jgi:hypothetical protein